MAVGRRMSTLMCLVLAALTLWLLPGSLQQTREAREDRVAERLAPAQTRLLTVWLLDDDTDGGRLLSRLLTAFERERGDARVRLRRVDAADLAAPDVVPPDVLLFSAYTLCGLEGRLLPIPDELPVREDALCAGRSQLRQLAVPLWFSPGVLVAPPEAAGDKSPATREPESWLAPRATAAAPTVAPDTASDPADNPFGPERIPWDALLAGSLSVPEGVARPQLTLCAPAHLRRAMAERLAGEDAQASPAPNAASFAVTTYRAWRQAELPGAAYALSPAACDAVLFAGLCRDSPQARALLQFLLSPLARREAAAEALFSCARDAEWPDDTDVARALAAVYGPSLVLPNAFARARQEAHALCRAGLADPAATLLSLR